MKSVRLADPRIAMAYLNALLEVESTESRPGRLCDGLRSIIEAHGVSLVMARSGMSRAGLYKSIHPNTMPRFETIMGLLEAMGMTLKVALLSEKEIERITQMHSKREIITGTVSEPKRRKEPVNELDEIEKLGAKELPNSSQTRPFDSISYADETF